MTSKMLGSLYLLVTFASFGYELGSAFKILVTPNNITDNVPTQVTISCRPGVSDIGHAYNIVVMQITKSGFKGSIATQNAGGTVVAKEYGDRVKTTGKIDASSVGLSFLNVTLAHPVDEDTGIYRCIVAYLTPNNEFHHEIYAANLNVKLPDTEAVVKTLKEKVSQLVKALEDQAGNFTRQNEIIEDQNELMAGLKRNLTLQESVVADQANTIDDLKSKVDTQDGIIDKLMETVKAQGKKLTELDEKLTNQAKKDVAILGLIATLEKVARNQGSRLVNLEKKECKCSGTSKSDPDLGIGENTGRRVAFTAGYNDKDHFVQGGTIIFSDVKAQVGNAYDPKTGFFEAPVDGIYVFFLNVMSGEKGHLLVDLKTHYRKLGRLFDYDNEHLDQTGLSRVVKLDAGDVVKADVYSMITGMTLKEYPYSFFSGFLLYKI